MAAKMNKILKHLRDMHDNEKHFMLLALAFILVIIFLILQQIFFTSESMKLPEIVTGSSVDEPLDDLQKYICETAEANGECNKIDDSYIVRKYNCCVKEAICCAK